MHGDGVIDTCLQRWHFPRILVCSAYTHSIAVFFGSDERESLQNFFKSPASSFFIFLHTPTAFFRIE